MLLKPDFGLISFSFAFLGLPVMTKSCIHYRHDDVFRPEHFSDDGPAFYLMAGDSAR